MFERSLDAVGDVQRRRVLTALLEQDRRDDDPIVHEDGDDATEVRRRLRDELHHVHLPKLEDEGFVVWNRDAGEITPGPRFEELRPLLRLLDDHAAVPPDEESRGRLERRTEYGHRRRRR